MNRNLLRLNMVSTFILFVSCASIRSGGDKSGEAKTPPLGRVQASAIQG